MPVDVLALGAVSLDEILYVEEYPSATAGARVAEVESRGGLRGLRSWRRRASAPAAPMRTAR